MASFSGMHASIGSVLQATKSWVGPGNKATRPLGVINYHTLNNYVLKKSHDCLVSFRSGSGNEDCQVLSTFIIT